jgi:hypothetical protein
MVSNQRINSSRAVPDAGGGPDYIGSQFGWEAVTDWEGEDFGDANKARYFVRIADDDFDSIWTCWFDFWRCVSREDGVGGCCNLRSDLSGRGRTFFLKRIRGRRWHLEVGYSLGRRGHADGLSTSQPWKYYM